MPWEAELATGAGAGLIPCVPGEDKAPDLGSPLAGPCARGRARTRRPPWFVVPSRAATS
ncbi:hypothetical protein PAHAL_3G240500 [Panicum hallii]|uniref:Uncharacterized protein n=1 Tax=Panicum hallii TaxID=206008 RepID=A0A2T8KJA5_9POAL|nr:hypothetical protein PAHAL_3G240500 [Panicum hallii]